MEVTNDYDNNNFILTGISDPGPTTVIEVGKDEFDIRNKPKLRKKTCESLEQTVSLLNSLKRFNLGENVNAKFDTIIKDITDAVDIISDQPIDLEVQYDKANDIFVLKFSDAAYECACNDLIERYKNEPAVKEGKTKFDKLAEVIRFIIFDKLTYTDDDSDLSEDID